MSDDAPDLLGAAHQIVVEQLTRLRDLVRQGEQQREQQTAELRRIERLLDEITMQQRFAAERKLPVAANLVTREQELRRQQETALHTSQQLQRALKELDQLVRQIDMSSTALEGENETADPWVLALRSQVIKGREEERVRLAREVHDSPAQVLANTLMGLERCRTLLQRQDLGRLSMMLDRLRDATQEGLHEVRHFIADLRPGRLEEQGLIVAIQEYIRRYSQAYNAHVSLEHDTLPRLGLETEIVLYRIVQEALQNVHKHARGASVWVSLHMRQGRLLLTIRDDGPGFDPHEVLRRAGRESWGLTSMRERAELIGARFVVIARSGQGTEVAVTLPLTANDVRS